MDTQAKRLRDAQPERGTKTYRIGLDVPTLERLISLEEITGIQAEVWIQAATCALLSTFEKQGFLTLPLRIVPLADPGQA